MMATSSNQQVFGSPRRVSQTLCNDRCQNILYKAVLEHFRETKNIAALLLTSKSFQNSSFGANYIVNFAVDFSSIDLFESVLSPSSCFSLQFVPSLHIKQTNFNSPKVNHSILNFVVEIVNSKYLKVSLRSLTLVSAFTDVVLLFFGIASNTWQQLQELRVANSYLNDDILKMISKAVHLRKVNLSGCSRISDDGLERLSELSLLTSLDLWGCDNITDAGLKHLSKLSNITFLNLSYCNNITDVGFEQLSKLVNVTSLNLDGCDKITDVGLEHVAISSVTSLSLYNCNLVTDVGLQNISELSGITSLNLFGCNKITDAGLEHVSKLSNITSLELRGCHNITPEAKQKLETALPNCIIVG